MNKDILDRIEWLVTRSNEIDGEQVEISTADFLCTDFKSEFECELLRLAVLKLLASVFINGAQPRAAMSRVYLFGKAVGLCRFGVRDLSGMFGVSLNSIRAEVKGVYLGLDTSAVNLDYVGWMRLVEFLFSAGPHPADVSRKLYSLSCAVSAPEVLELNMRDLGKLIGEGAGCRRWRLKAVLGLLDSKAG